MERIFPCIFAFVCFLAFSAAGNTAGTAMAETTGTSALNSGTNSTKKGSKVLVAYFSATGTTRFLAEYAAEILHADIYEIVPAVPYSSADLNYTHSSSRSTREQRDSSARPAISGTVQNMADYDTVFLGYPIWNGEAPRIINTFLEMYDLSGKTIAPFGTSHSSGIGSSDKNLHALAPHANWLAGQRFGGNTSQNTLAAWIKSLNLPKTPTLVSRTRAFDWRS